MKYSYPLLDRLFDYFNKSPHEVDDYYLVCCQHLLEPQLKMFDYLIDFGFNSNKIILLGKAYSTNSSILQEFKEKGIKVFQPEFSGKSFDQEHKNNCEMISTLVPKEAKFIILDDGGELIKTFSHNKNVLFSIEQTSSGFRKLENEKIDFPIFNVARSDIKLTQESPFIARLCFERIKDYFQEKRIKDPSILVVGLGSVGEAIREIFKTNNFIVEGFDIKHGHKNLLRNIIDTKVNVIVGATGSVILSREDIDKLLKDKKYYFISVSSSDREFPVVSFRKNKEIHTDVIYKNIRFVNNGFPVTFRGNRIENTPIEMEKTMCLLAGSIMYGVLNKLKDNGFIKIPKELEDIINQSL